MFEDCIKHMAHVKITIRVSIIVNYSWLNAKVKEREEK